MARVPPTPNYRARLADAPLAELVEQLPAILVNGPRAVGKTTTARQLANEEVRLDQPGSAAAFRADVDAALRNREEPLLVDEWQEVPEVLAAVKRAVDDDPRAGRFILTGSVRADLETRVWPGTGRLVRISIYGMTERERLGGLGPGTPGFLDRLSTGDENAFRRLRPPLNVRDYVNIAVRGGFPDVVIRNLSDTAVSQWLHGYLDQLLTRDTVGVIPEASHQKLEAYFEVLALSTAGMPKNKTLYDAAGINARTAANYDKLLKDLFIAEQLPAWRTNRLSRLSRAAKRYIVDPALAITAAGLDAETILAEGDQLGRVLDSLILSQLRPEVALESGRLRLYHLREEHGRREVDVIAEMPGGRVMGLEIKASSDPTESDAKHLCWLRDQLGSRFLSGAVIHTGPEVFKIADRILALPISAIWV